MAICELNLVTTGVASPVDLSDLGFPALVHPASFDLLNYVGNDAICISQDLQDALDAGEVTLQNENGTFITDVSDTGPGGTAGGGSPLTTKGDLYTFDTSDARLPVGADGFVLTANSATATGLEWSASGGGGEVNTASNVGLGAGAFKQKTGADLEFKSFIGGTNVTVVNNTDDLTFNVAIPDKLATKGDILTFDTADVALPVGTDGQFLVANSVTATGLEWQTVNLGEDNTASNVGAGEGVFKQKTGVDLEFKTLIGGTGITLTGNTDDVTIDADPKLDAKGELLTHNGTAEVQLTVGTDNQVLIADSVQAEGLRYGLIDTANIADQAVTINKIAAGDVIGDVVVAYTYQVGDFATFNELIYVANSVTTGDIGGADAANWDVWAPVAFQAPNSISFLVTDNSVNTAVLIDVYADANLGPATQLEVLSPTNITINSVAIGIGEIGGKTYQVARCSIDVSAAGAEPDLSVRLVNPNAIGNTLTATGGAPILFSGAGTVELDLRSGGATLNVIDTGLPVQGSTDVLVSDATDFNGFTRDATNGIIAGGSGATVWAQFHALTRPRANVSKVEWIYRISANGSRQYMNLTSIEGFDVANSATNVVTSSEIELGTHFRGRDFRDAEGFEASNPNSFITDTSLNGLNTNVLFNGAAYYRMEYDLTGTTDGFAIFQLPDGLPANWYSTATPVTLTFPVTTPSGFYLQDTFTTTKRDTYTPSIQWDGTGGGTVELLAIRITTV